MRTQDDVNRYLRFVNAMLAGPDSPEKPTRELYGEKAALEWMLGLRELPDLENVDAIERLLRGPQ